MLRLWVYHGPTVGQPNGQRLARRRLKFVALIEQFPHRTDEFNARIAEIDEKLANMHFCRRCGRPLKTAAAKEQGYGPECLRKSQSESADTLSQERTP